MELYSIVDITTGNILGFRVDRESAEQFAKDQGIYGPVSLRKQRSQVKIKLCTLAVYDLDAIKTVYPMKSSQGEIVSFLSTQLVKFQLTDEVMKVLGTANLGIKEIFGVR